jgi:hypothetical protein
MSDLLVFSLHFKHHCTGEDAQVKSTILESRSECPNKYLDRDQIGSPTY